MNEIIQLLEEIGFQQYSERSPNSENKLFTLKTSDESYEIRINELKNYTWPSDIIPLSIDILVIGKRNKSKIIINKNDLINYTQKIKDMFIDVIRDKKISSVIEAG